MAIRNREDAVEVEGRIGRIFRASASGRAGEIRGLFAEVLDFEPDFGDVSLAGASGIVHLPASAERVAVLDDVHVLHVGLQTNETDRVRKAEADAAARVIEDQLGDDLLLVFTNTSANQLHFIHPSFKTARPTLRRIIVERDLPHRTAVRQVSSIYWNLKESDSIRAALEEAFDVEPVTRDFFREYKRIFNAVEDRVIGFGQSDEEDEVRRMFVQTLFNRLMFVYFLQRKGWLEFQGGNDYLNALWEDYRGSKGQTNFYKDRLVPLFFEGLNNPQSRESRSRNPEMYSLIGAPPFLNGGLFDQGELDRRSGIAVPDDAVGPVLSDLFDRFNFTVMESTPFDIEVAVDPEMLGKVFEELVTARHESGAYYTPRPVVAFMCREAIKGYLDGQNTGVRTGAIGEFVDTHATDGIALPEARRIAKALEEIAVIDPACGSGAYLLGMMQELIELQTALFNAGVGSKAIYQMKLEIIQRNLFGVDNDYFAVNIAMLRLWLSLAVDYEGDDPDPLPNLDFKIVYGDSLLGPDPRAAVEVQGTLGQDVDLMRQLGQSKSEYIYASTGPDKERMRIVIQGLEARVEATVGSVGAPSGSVDWRVEFAEIFAGRGGFDVVVANPPYVRQEEIGSVKPALRTLYKDSTHARSDLYCYFYVRAMQLLRNGGIHVFVCSNSWLDTQYGAKLQEYLLENARVRAVYDSAVERQFSTAAINTIISIAEKTVGDDLHQTVFISLLGEFQKALADPQLRREVKVSSQTLVEGILDTSSSEGHQRLVSGKWGGKYLRAPDIYYETVHDGQRIGNVLSDYVRGERYLNTGGADGFFILTDVTPVDEETMKVTIQSKEGREWGSPEFLIEREFLRPGYRKTNSARLRIEDPDCYVLAIPPDTPVRKYRVAKYIAWARMLVLIDGASHEHRRRGGVPLSKPCQVQSFYG